ncbi:filamentous hemagglutinin N-terminal domain-containing protein [Mariniblastus sp.]|nr:filamentous hemagglutinin N-terminal domain-containing protein [Mariniblastus sp.]MDB4756839.1 filamentous hemagglutinin N-terminal domain-containing protein [Mariniblastus sp.]
MMFRSRGRKSRRLISWAIVYLQIFLILVHDSTVLADQEGGVVVAGQATISQSPKTLTVNQSSDRAIVNWNSFSIQQDEAAVFNLPHSSSAVLNRVTGGNPSAVLGQLQSNGKVFLINPNGILVGPDANINVGGMVASSLNVTNKDFMAGGPLAFQGESQGGVYNYGTIRALEGNLYLIGAHVENHGLLEAKNGTVGLAAGQQVTLVDSAHPSLKVEPSKTVIGGTGVLNTGVVDAIQAELYANGGNVYGLAINNEGTIRANGVENRGGRIFMVAKGGHIRSSGKLLAKVGRNGGEVDINAGGAEGTIADISGHVDVSGIETGGNVNIRAGTIDIVGANVDITGQQPGNLALLLGESTIIVAVPGNSPVFNPGQDNNAELGNPGNPSGNYNQLTQVNSTEIDARNSSGPSADDYIIEISSTEDISFGGPGGEISAVDGTLPTLELTPDTLQSVLPFEGFTGVSFTVNEAASTDGGTVRVTVDGVKGNGIAFSFSVTSALGGNDNFAFEATQESGDVITRVTVDGLGGADGLSAQMESIKVIKLEGQGEVPLPGVIHVEKIAIGPAGSSTEFGFEITDSSSNTVAEFRLLDDGINDTYSEVFGTGTYNLAELTEPGWLVSSININDPSGGSSQIDPNTAQLELLNGESVYVTFTNTQAGKIVLQKVVETTTPDNDTFVFQADGFEFQNSGQSSTVLGNNDIDESGFLQPGQYSVNELIPEGWELEIAHDDLTGSTLVNNETGQTSIDLAAGETVNLVYTNTELGEIVVNKSTVGGDGTFSFTGNNLAGFDIDTAAGSGSRTFTNIDPDLTYGVSELVPEGWKLSSSSFSSSTSIGAPDKFLVAPGGTVTLDFVNTKSKQPTILVDLVPFRWDPIYPEGIARPSTMTYGPWGSRNLDEITGGSNADFLEQ